MLGDCSRMVLCCIPWRSTVEARPLYSKTSPSSDPFSPLPPRHPHVVTLESSWAQDRPANGSGGVRHAPALGVMGTVDGRDGEVGQLWPWRGFDHLVATRHLQTFKGCFRWIECTFSMAPALYSAFGVAVSPQAHGRWKRVTHPQHALAQVRHQVCASPRLCPLPNDIVPARIHTCPSRYDCHRYNPSTSNKISYSQYRYKIQEGTRVERRSGYA